MALIKRALPITTISTMGLAVHLVVLSLFVLPSANNLLLNGGTKNLKVKMARNTKPPKTASKRIQVAIKRIRKTLKRKSKLKPPDKIRVSKKLIERGRELAGKDGVRLGSFPGLTAEFRETMGWAAYWLTMKRVGARFFIYDGVEGRILCELKASSCHPIRSFSGLSPRSRDVTHLPEARAIIDKLAPGKGNRLILLLPMKVDHIILAAQEKVADSNRLRLQNFSRFYGVYHLRQGNLVLRITGGHLTSGQNFPMVVEVNLGRVS
jgi:hypothetical protein